MAVSPAAEQIPHASDPLVAPAATRAPARRPARSELRSTSRLSGPGVTVRISDKTANAAILSIMALPAFLAATARGIVVTFESESSVVPVHRCRLSAGMGSRRGVGAQCRTEVGEQPLALPTAHGCGRAG